MIGIWHKYLQQVQLSLERGWHTDTLPSGSPFSFLPSPQLSLQPRCPFTALGVPAMCQKHSEPPLITLYSNIINYLSLTLPGNSHKDRTLYILFIIIYPAPPTSVLSIDTRFIFVELNKPELLFHFLNLCFSNSCNTH